MKLVLLVLIFFPTMTLAEEVRGTWVTTTASDALATRASIATTMRQLAEIGLNTVYVECWKNGYTEFPSQTLKHAIGVTHKLNFPRPDPTRDLLAETVQEAHANNLRCIAWFEYGFMAAPKHTRNELRERRDWISLNHKGGDIADNGFAWLNPIHPDAQQLLLGIVLEAVKNYDIDGIQLDDRIVWPGLEMGYDQFTVNAYAKEHNGNPPPADIRDREWCAWRENKISDFAKVFVTRVREAKPTLTISLSPGPHPWARENYLCNWPQWASWDKKGGATWDEFIPQCYRLDYTSFERSWNEQLQAIGDRRRDLIAGIRVVGEGPDLSWDDLKKSIELVRRSGAGGHCLWFSRGVLEVYPRELKEFYRSSR